MKELLDFIIKNITQSDDVEIEETTDNGRVNLTVKAPSDVIGMVIGKNGNTIKSIQNILRVKGKLDDTYVYVNVEESS